jgi:hypothetical protein
MVSSSRAWLCAFLVELAGVLAKAALMLLDSSNPDRVLLPAPSVAAAFLMLTSLLFGQQQ